MQKTTPGGPNLWGGEFPQPKETHFKKKFLSGNLFFFFVFTAGGLFHFFRFFKNLVWLKFKVLRDFSPKIGAPQLGPISAFLNFFFIKKKKPNRFVPDLLWVLQRGKVGIFPFFAPIKKNLSQLIFLGKYFFFFGVWGGPFFKGGGGGGLRLSF